MLDELEKMLEKDDNLHSPKRKSLGRGLGALLGDDDDVDFGHDNSNVVENLLASSDNFISIDKIIPGKYQPRTEFDEESLKALSESIKEKGVLQPLLVRSVGDKYEIIAGERRWRASKMAGLNKVPVIEKNLSDKEVLEVALVENLLRENLSAIEEAEGFQRLINEFSHTQEALAQIVGKSRSHVANMLRLLNLPQAVQAMVKESKLSAGHARALVGLDNAEVLAKQIISKDLSVREVEELVSKQKEPLPKKKTSKDEDLAEIEKSLVKQLGLRIKISQSKQGGGKVVLQYASVAELDMIIDILEQKRKNESLPASNTVFKAAEPVTNTSSEKFSIKLID